MTSSGDIISADTLRKADKALKMRREGKTYRAIADELDLSNPGNAHRLVKRALAMTLQESADDLRQLDASRIDALIAAHWKAATGVSYDDEGKAVAPDAAAGNLVLRAIDRHVKLFGLDMPTKVQLSGDSGNPLVIEISPDLLPDAPGGGDAGVSS